MKGRGARNSLFWSRLLGLLIAFAIVAVMVFGGVQQLMDELSAVYHTLAVKQVELHMARTALSQADAALQAKQNELATSQQELALTQDIARKQARVLQHNAHALQAADAQTRQLIVQRDDLRRANHEASNALADSEQKRHAQSLALQRAETELKQLQQQPKLSIIVSTERVMKRQSRERLAASHTKFMSAGDHGSVVFEQKQVEHSREESALYAERTRIVITQTSPGNSDHLLECYHNDNCGQIIAARSSESQLAYSYQSRFRAMQRELTMLR